MKFLVIRKYLLHKFKSSKGNIQKNKVKIEWLADKKCRQHNRDDNCLIIDIRAFIILGIQ